jgi:hypothetical protein
VPLSRATDLGDVKSGLSGILQTTKLTDFRHKVRLMQEERRDKLRVASGGARAEGYSCLPDDCIPLTVFPPTAFRLTVFRRTAFPRDDDSGRCRSTVNSCAAANLQVSPSYTPKEAGKKGQNSDFGNDVKSEW